ncbi:MAG: hypothetical protein NC037_01170 [Bacteroides sp.]|nr:hypothetical protein [Bacillota bacterium]MCM1393808.1 hypothetical protein [[Eubacterium] siraeum]MCM1455127.1 hypothetical protein [Bacteroides sp.]
MDEEILKGLLKRAKGYSYKEVQEEYAVKDDGEIALTKRKVTEKYCPPDSGALKTYMELNGERSLEEYSDEELEKERRRLLAELKAESSENTSD